MFWCYPRAKPRPVANRLPTFDSPALVPRFFRPFVCFPIVVPMMLRGISLDGVTNRTLAPESFFRNSMARLLSQFSDFGALFGNQTRGKLPLVELCSQQRPRLRSLVVVRLFQSHLRTRRGRHWRAGMGRNPHAHSPAERKRERERERRLYEPSFY